jgi:hypothetical protein
VKKIVLNSAELEEYNKKIVSVIPTLQPGKYYFKDFFIGDVTSPRIARKFFEDVRDHVFPRVSFAGRLSREGYIVS